MIPFGLEDNAFLRLFPSTSISIHRLFRVVGIMLSHFLKFSIMLSAFAFGFRHVKLNNIRRFTSKLNDPTNEAAATPAPVVSKTSSDLSCLEIRIGKIVEIGKHPEAENLYVEKVDLGEPEGPRTIVSGLVQYCTVESLLNRNVIVLCNLKPRALKGITSNGMLLCASNADHTKVEPIDPPAGANIGELISFAENIIKPVEPGNKATKSFSKIADDFYVDESGIATFRGVPFMTSAGPVTATLKGKIS